MKGGEPMKKLLVIALVVVVALVLSVPAFAVGPGKSVEFAGGSAGKVVFSGDAHKKAGACNACHPAIFKMAKGAGAGQTMKDMEAGKGCGTCHNGTKAFSSKDCAKCHKK
jgi:c(7)-type cytochrome triheme protein